MARYHGFNGTVVFVSGTMALVQLWLGIVAIPLAVDKAPSSEWYGILILITGAILTLPLTYFANWIVSRMAEEYLDIHKVLELANNDGWIHTTQVSSLKTERHLPTNLSATVMVDTLRNGSFMLFQYLSIIGIEYGIYIYGRLK